MALLVHRTMEGDMLFNLPDLLRQLVGGDKKKKPLFRNEKEAYEFCRTAYRESGGVTPELRRAYDFYKKNYNDDCGRAS